MKKNIILLGALDTKGADYAFLKECIVARGCSTLLVDVGVLGAPTIAPDIAAADVAAAAGQDLAALRARGDRGAAVGAMARGATMILTQLHAEGRLDGVIALGGTGGTAVACAAMRGLPLGVPKVMVTTVAGGDVSGYVGVSDITMMPSITDVAGINRISRGVFARAAGAVCGMADTHVPAGSDRPLIAASMFGNTTRAVERAKATLEAEGFEMLVFHCTGTGGRMLEQLVTAGQIAGVLDITTTEWADELVGGVFTAGPDRLGAAARAGVPAIVTPACLDMVNFWAPATVPPQFAGRTFYQHNPNVTLLRTNVAECRQLGRILAEKLNASTGPVTVLLPLRGLSMLDAPGGPFWLPDADAALFAALKEHLRKDIPLIEMDCNVNDPEFADRCAACLLAHLRAATSRDGKENLQP